MARLQGEGLEKVLRYTYYGYTCYDLELLLYLLCVLERQLDLVWLTMAHYGCAHTAVLTMKVLRCFLELQRRSETESL